MPPLLAALSLSLFAQALPDPKSPASLGWLALGIAALFGTWNQIMGGLVNWRKLRGHDRDADDRYATKAEHALLSNQVAEVKGQVTALNTTVANELRSINRSLGRLEGAAGTAPQSKD
jgi:hypothetical protein